MTWLKTPAAPGGSYHLTCIKPSATLSLSCSFSLICIWMERWLNFFFNLIGISFKAGSPPDKNFLLFSFGGTGGGDSAEKGLFRPETEPFVGSYHALHYHLLTPVASQRGSPQWSCSSLYGWKPKFCRSRSVRKCDSPSSDSPAEPHPISESNQCLTLCRVSSQLSLSDAFPYVW